jgi:hypothetical protein
MTEPNLYKTEKEFTDETWSVQQDWELDSADYRKYVRQINVDLSKVLLHIMGTMQSCIIKYRKTISRFCEYEPR